MDFQDVLNFWFEEIDSKFWFQKNAQFDRQVRSRFLQTFEDAMRGNTVTWRQTADGRLAEIIVLDQFSRNMFRDSARAFSADALALSLAREAVKLGEDQNIAIERRSFIYMPYMHSEDSEAHQEALELFSQKGLEYNLKYELLHKGIIDRFGRYPHRNEILGRVSTPEEIAFLKEPGSSF